VGFPVEFNLRICHLALFPNDGDEDTYGENIESVVKKLEDLLRPKLRLEQAKKKRRWFTSLKKNKSGPGQIITHRTIVALTAQQVRLHLMQKVGRMRANPLAPTKRLLNRSLSFYLARTYKFSGAN
jgi:hypothetical protein